MTATTESGTSIEQYFALTEMPFLSLPSQALAGLVGLMVVAAFAYQQMQINILRWMIRTTDERRFRRFWGWRLKRHKQIYSELNKIVEKDQPKTPREKRLFTKLRRRYPKRPHQIQASRLANAIMRAETGPWLGVDASLAIVGPPLMNLLTSEERLAIDEPREDIHTGIGLMFGLGLVALTSLATVPLVILDDKPATAAAFLLTLSAIAGLGSAAFYERALTAVEEYKQGLDLTFLLYRYRLLDHLDLGRPNKLSEEPGLFKTAVELIAWNDEHKRITNVENSTPQTVLSGIDFSRQTSGDNSESD